MYVDDLSETFSIFVYPLVGKKAMFILVVNMSLSLDIASPCTSQYRRGCHGDDRRGFRVGTVPSACLK